MSLTAGFSVTDITPPLGWEMPGGFFKRFATGVHDELMVRAAWFDNGDRRLAVASVDCVSFDADAYERARSLVREMLGEDVPFIAAATHTHSGGPSTDVLMSEKCPGYSEWLGEKIGSAIIMAGQDAQPVFLRLGQTEVEGVAFNRRFLLKDGSTRTNPGYGNPDLVRPLGPVDPALTTIGVYDELGNLLGCVMNFTCHSTFMFQTLYSGDYSACIERFMGVPVVFINGAMGDINQCDFVGLQQARDARELLLEAGGKLAAEAFASLARVAGDDDVALQAANAAVSLPVRGPDADQLAAARTLWESDSELDQAKVYARELLLLDERLGGKTQWECPLQGLRIGECAIVGGPVQPFCQIGLDIKEGLGPVMVSSLANGHLGYMGLVQHYDEGGYELELKRTSMLAPGAGEAYVTTAREVVAQL